MILELVGADDARHDTIAWLRDEGCIVDDMSGDIVAG